MSAGDLLRWWNLVFLVPGAAGTLIGLLAMIGVGDHDVVHEVDHDLEHDGDHDVEHEAAGHGGWVDSALSFLGFGRIPFGLALMSLMLFFALFGLSANAALGPLLPFALPLTAAVALGGSALATRGVGRLFARWVPRHESHASTFEGLAGCTGTIVTLLSPAEGYAQVHDRFGNMQEVRCASSRGEALRRDMPVLVVEARPVERLVLVVENDLETRVRWASPLGSGEDAPASPPGSLPPAASSRGSPTPTEAPRPREKRKEEQR